MSCDREPAAAGSAERPEHKDCSVDGSLWGLEATMVEADVVMDELV